MSSRTAIACYSVWMVLLAELYYALPAAQLWLWTLIGWSSAIAIVWGVRRNRPRLNHPWMILAVAVALFVTGDTANRLPGAVGAPDEPLIALANVCYLLLFPLLTVGFVIFSRAGSARRDQTSIQDAFTLASAAGLLSWIFLITPNVRDPDLSVVERVTLVMFPLGDVILLAIITRLVIGSRRSWALLTLASGGAGLLISDVLFGIMKLHGSWQPGGAVDLGWIAFYTLWGLAALHPSMGELTEPRALRPTETSLRRLLLPGLSSLVAPAVLFLQARSGEVRDGTAIALMSTVIFALVMVRLARVVNTHRQALARERGLRQAGAELVSAATPSQVEAALRRAVARLLPAETRHEVRFVAAGDPAGASLGVGEPQLRYAGSLPRAVAADLEPFEIALSCPLLLDERRSRNPLVGTLLVAASEAALVNIRGGVEVLAAQAALALDRVRLTEEINRRRSDEYFRTLVQNTSDVILILDGDRRIRYASPSVSGVFGSSDLVGVSLYDLLGPADHGRVDAILDAATPGDQRSDGTDWLIEVNDGGVVQVEAWFQDLRADPTVQGVVVTLRDVTAQRQLERDLTYQAFHDLLTGLPNRVLFHERMQQAVIRARRTGAVVGVIFVDLDDFKVINEMSGHDQGDDLLTLVGRRLEEVVPEHDTVARLGSDEFVVLVEESSSPFEVDAVIERVLGAFGEPFTAAGGKVTVTACAGAATTVEATSAQDLLRQADLALNAAKQAGKGQWRRYQSALHTELLRRLEMRSALERALADREFVLYYQPLIALSSGETVGFEALIRWSDPNRGLIPPDQFIDVAEETGLIVPVGAWVLEQAINTVTSWHETTASRPYISVNVSVAQLREPGFVALVQRLLDKSGLAPGHLILELTESLMLRDDEQVWNDLNTLRELGVRVAIDDFGTGYSSLSYLRQAPVDLVKIDRAFVDAVGSSEQQRALVAGIVRLAHTLELEVVAEGIEQDADRRVLYDLGCQFGQGYLFARPMPHHEATRWLLAERTPV